LGPVSPRPFPPAPGWSVNGHRRTAPLDDRRGPEQVGVDGAWRGRAGQALTFTAPAFTAPARTTAGYLRRLAAVDQAHPAGERHRISDPLSRHTRGPIQAGLFAHPRGHPVPLPTGAGWLHRQAGGWRLFRRAAFAGQSFADAPAIDQAAQVATAHLNARAKPWVWGRPPRPHRTRRLRFVYCL
jgi:hypothetical protein